MDPVRTCLGCRRRASAHSLLRVVAHDGIVVPDPSATRTGRGAWVHPDIGCLDTALSRKAFGRALRDPAAVVDAEALRAFVREATTTHHPSSTPPGS